MTRRRFSHPQLSHPAARLLQFVASLFIASTLTGASLADEGWIELFNGKDLSGWKVNENTDSVKVEDGLMVVHGPRAHAFYVGSGEFKNFYLKAELMTYPKANSGIYFHTKYQADGWPKKGFECQVNVSHKDPKKTSSLYGVVNVADPGVKDNQWYTQEIIVKGKNVKLIVNGKTMVDYTEPDDAKPAEGGFDRLIGKGTFALQAHDPKSKVYFRNLRVKPL